ncbi:hypothetical protein E2C01_042832 [Portunus trituberculatus]|uniref:Uncharacterized protein n=1 Tax=Portunus trituberculatus TaxID=210409 RepID=A0A5B7FR97_PORTR|nr:hypothetical protein [Portunus trituberculatus]
MTSLSTLTTKFST